MASLESVEGNVGRIFPKQLSPDNQDVNLKHPFDKLYEILCYKYQMRKITLDDFKDFRKVLGTKKINDIEEYMDLIFYFLSLSEEELDKKLQYFDEKLACHALEVKSKEIEKDEVTGKVKEKYIFLPKNPSFSDIITVSCAIHSQLISVFCPIIDSCFIGKEDLDLQDKLLLCNEILDNDLQDASSLNEIILESFEEKYQPFKNILELEEYHSDQRKRIIERARQRICQKKKKYLTELERSYRSHSLSRWYEHDIVSYKRGGKKFGHWPIE